MFWGALLGPAEAGSAGNSLTTQRPAAAKSTQAGAGANESRGTLEFGGLTRTYLVHLPLSYDARKRWPLVLALHGGGGAGPGTQRLTHLGEIADRRGFIVVYPDGIRRGWADGRSTTAAERSGVDDVGFISALLDKLAGEYSIDSARVYATGISNGGFMAQRLACELSGRVAAVASVAATVGEGLAARCKPSRRVPVMMIHGTEDPLVPWAGGEVKVGARGRILSVNATVRKWASLDGCASTPIVTESEKRSADGMHVRREVFPGCKDGAEVVLYAIEGGGHTWSGGLQYLPERIIGKTSREIDAGEVIWEFFSRHPKK
jgi:polyhydroxybutyrate depolymerase